jgi:hypothetical protein
LKKFAGCENKKSKQSKLDQIKTISPSILTFVNFMPEQATIQRAGEAKREDQQAITGSGADIQRILQKVKIKNNNL